jgi:hypothetical protein
VKEEKNLAAIMFAVWRASQINARLQTSARKIYHSREAFM